MLGACFSDDDVDATLFLLDRTTVIDLGSLGGARVDGYAMNNAGQVAGSSSLADKAEMHPFVWNGKEMLDLATVGGRTGYGGWAADINASGQVAGTMEKLGLDPNTYYPDRFRAFLWDGRELILLDPVSDGWAWAWALNDRGEVVGLAGDRAFLWDGTATRDLGSLAGDHGYSWAMAINNHGVVAGMTQSRVFTDHAFVYLPGRGMFDLNDLAASNDWIFTHGLAINNRGQIVVRGVRDEEEHVFLLTPRGRDR